MKADTRSFYQNAVQRAVSWIVEHLDDALDLGSLARDAALSPFHFHRVFRGMVGETPLELQRRLRLERAAARLLEGDDAVTGVAFEAGYETHESFTRAFRAAYGLAPSAYRHQARLPRHGCLRIQTELAAPSGIHFGFEAASRPFVPISRGESTMNVTIRDMPELRLATVRHVGAYQRISEAFQRLGAIAGPAGLFRRPNAADAAAVPTGMGVAVYHDDPDTTSEPELRSDAGVVVGNDAVLPAGVVELRLGAGRYATMTHVGPYSALGDAWGRLMGEWLPKSGERVGGGLAYEVYRNDPMHVSESELRTELYVPLLPSS